MSLIEIIVSLGSNHNLTKHEQLVQGVIEAIEQGSLQRGDQLPSINQMVAELGFARKTIVKAYEVLKDRGLVESKKLKGYFIVSEETNVTLRIAMVLYEFQRFQEEFYDTFRKELGKRIQIDIFFHHNNLTLFESIFANIEGKYGKYVIAPIQEKVVRNFLIRIPPSKLLIVDRAFHLPDSYSFITQDFGSKTYEKLESFHSGLKKYGKCRIYADTSKMVPELLLETFRKFFENNHMAYQISGEYESGSLAKDTLYVCLGDSYLWEILKDCQNFGFSPGKDLGILSHDDHVVKEIISGGITTISTDFHQMGKMAAEHIKQGGQIQHVLPVNLIERGSI